MLSIGPNPPQAKFVTQLKFVVREDADSLVVASSTDQGSQIDIWELREKPVTIHAMFQQKHNDSKTVVSFQVSKQNNYLLIFKFYSNFLCHLEITDLAASFAVPEHFINFMPHSIKDINNNCSTSSLLCACGI